MKGVKMGEEPKQPNSVQVLERQIAKLAQEKQELQVKLNNITNLFRFTLGIAVQARPEVPQLKAMVDMIYKVKDDNGQPTDTRQ